MAHYIAYATETGTSRPEEMLEQVHAMMSMGLWGLPTTAMLGPKLLRGDGMIVAVGAPYRQFVGDAVLDSGYRKFSEAERVTLPPGLEGFSHGLTLTRTRIWHEAVSIDEIFPLLGAAKKDPKAQGFLSALRSVTSTDAAIIVAAGTKGLQGPERNARDEAEDERVIAVMNEKRAGEGRPPLTPEQEAKVRANRRSRGGT